MALTSTRRSSCKLSQQTSTCFNHLDSLMPRGNSNDNIDLSERPGWKVWDISFLLEYTACMHFLVGPRPGWSEGILQLTYMYTDIQFCIVGLYRSDCITFIKSLQSNVVWLAQSRMHYNYERACQTWENQTREKSLFLLPILEWIWLGAKPNAFFLAMFVAKLEDFCDAPPYIHVYNILVN